jgi:hypothetical protein
MRDSCVKFGDGGKKGDSQVVKSTRSIKGYTASNFEADIAELLER